MSVSVKTITTRKHHKCHRCKKKIKRGDRAVRKKYFCTGCDDDGPYFGTYALYYHLKCNYKNKVWSERAEAVFATCIHPKEHVEEVWTNDEIPVPDYDICHLCNKRI